HQDLVKMYGGHLRACHITGSDSSIVLVPWEPGDEGGWPFKWKGRTIFIEDSMLDPATKEAFKERINKYREQVQLGNYFNSGTLLMPINSELLGNTAWDLLRDDPRLMRASIKAQNRCWAVDINTIAERVPEA